MPPPPNPVGHGPTSEWQAGAPQPGSLRSSTLALWAWPIEAAPAGAWGVISEDERGRAERFQFDRHREAFVAARAGLRLLLASQLGVAPGSLGFQLGPHGKPTLTGSLAGAVEFNLSHSGGWALAGVMASTGVGIDIEGVRPSEWAQPIAERYFAPEEAAEFRNAGPRDRDARFCSLWTRKEAVVKLLGSGLSYPLGAFRTPPEGGEGWCQLPAPAAGEPKRCWVACLSVASGYAAAYAAWERPAQVTRGLLDLSPLH